MGSPDVDEAVARARLLADRHPAAADILIFYAKLVEYQGSLCNAHAAKPTRHAGARTETSVQTVPDERRVIAAIPAFLEWLCREAPPGLAENARDLSRLDAAEWHRHVRAAFADPPGGQGTGSETAMFVVEALIQPLTEEPDDGRLLPDTPAAPGKDQRRCPACGCLPVLGVLHEEGHGAGRMLVCARCGGAWPYPRVSCPGCGAREFDALPVYTAEQFPHVRLDACDRCRRYLKTVDLTKDGLAVPQVDDLASLSLDLWARQQGYVRLRVNLLRT